MGRVLAVLVVVTIMSAMAALVMLDNPPEGPTVVVLSRTHGLHRLDVMVVAGYLVAVVCCVLLALPKRR